MSAGIHERLPRLLVISTVGTPLWFCSPPLSLLVALYATYCDAKESEADRSEILRLEDGQVVFAPR